MSSRYAPLITHHTAIDLAHASPGMTRAMYAWAFGRSAIEICLRDIAL